MVCGSLQLVTALELSCTHLLLAALELPHTRLPRSAYVSIRQHTTHDVSIRQQTPAYVSILRTHLLVAALEPPHTHTLRLLYTSAYVSTRHIDHCEPAASLGGRAVC